MARRNENKGTTNKGQAIATIQGIVKSAYTDGNKYDYITIQVNHSYDEYYDIFKVAVSKNYEIPNDGEPITIDCNMRNYKGMISFKEVSADTL